MTPPRPRPPDPIRFFRSIDPLRGFHQLFDPLPGIAFFAKDRRFRLMAASRSFLQRLGFDREDQVIGRDDFELFPRRLAEAYRRDDEEVLATGRPKLRVVELFLSPQGLPEWYLTNKLPLRDRRGRVIGLMGTVEALAGAGGRGVTLGPLSAAVDRIRANHRASLPVAHLARDAGMSVRTLNRRFREAFGMAPRAFMLRTRLLAAHEELARSDRPILDIALEHGFCDQSSFSQHFRRQFGITPLRHRRRHRA